jgi:gluconolactonase
VIRLGPNGGQQVITRKHSARFAGAGSEAARYLEGTLPNGLAFAANGDILISNFGTDCLEIMTRDGDTRVLADSIDGEAIGKVNFVLRDSRNRIWITVSTRVKNWMRALRTDLPDGYLARYEDGKFRIVADGFRFTNEIRFDAREEFCTSSKLPAAVLRACASMNAASRQSGRSSDQPGWEKGRGPTASRSTATATFGEPWSIPTSCSC